jgi:hypothetical protein
MPVLLRLPAVQRTNSLFLKGQFAVTGMFLRLFTNSSSTTPSPYDNMFHSCTPALWTWMGCLLVGAATFTNVGHLVCFCLKLCCNVVVEKNMSHTPTGLKVSYNVATDVLPFTMQVDTMSGNCIQAR